MIGFLTDYSTEMKRGKLHFIFLFLVHTHFAWSHHIFLTLKKVNEFYLSGADINLKNKVTADSVSLIFVNGLAAWVLIKITGCVYVTLFIEWVSMIRGKKVLCCPPVRFFHFGVGWSENFCLVLFFYCEIFMRCQIWNKY